VDAGDCSGGNVTRLGTGSGLNGSSAGGNNLSGSAFNSAAPWAIENFNASATPAVYADHDIFGAVVGSNVRAAFYDPNAAVIYSQIPQELAPPPAANLMCLSQVPAGATNLASFTNQGGYFSASAATVSFIDNPVFPYFTGNGSITRTYTVQDACGVSSTSQQKKTVTNTVPPVITGMPPNIVTNTGFGRGTCDQVVVWVPPTANNQETRSRWAPIRSLTSPRTPPATRQPILSRSL
jgi:hypothetical protein